MPLKKLSLFILSLFPMLGLSTPRAIILGGGQDERIDFIVPPAKNWNLALQMLGWKTTVVFGDSKSVLPKFADDQLPATVENINNAFGGLLKEVRAGDEVMVIFITHGLRKIKINKNNWHVRVANRQTITLDDRFVPIEQYFPKLKALDIKNGAAKVMFLNHSCYSGLSVLKLKNSGLCAASISGPDQIGMRGNFSEVLAVSLSGQEDKFVGKKMITEFGNFTLGELFSKALALDDVTPAVYSIGFGLEGLNVQDHENFLNHLEEVKTIELGDFSGIKNLPSMNVLDSLDFRNFLEAKKWQEFVSVMESNDLKFLYEIESFFNNNFGEVVYDEEAFAYEDENGPLFPSKSYILTSRNNALYLFVRILLMSEQDLKYFHSATLVDYVKNNKDRLSIKARKAMKDFSMSEPFKAKSKWASFKKSSNNQTPDFSLRNQAQSRAFLNSDTECSRFNLDHRTRH